MNKYLHDDVALIKQHQYNPAPQYSVRLDMNTIGTSDEVHLFIQAEYEDAVIQRDGIDSVVAVCNDLALAFQMRDAQQAIYSHDTAYGDSTEERVAQLLNQAH